MDEQQKKWEGLFRGSVLSTLINKHVQTGVMADTRAQGLILLNAALVPLAINGMATDALQTAAVICVITSLLTITSCIFCLYPKRLSPRSGHRNILHFTEFSRMKEDIFLEEMKGLFADKEKLAEAAVRDLHHLGSRIIAPKYFFLRIAYCIFLVGQLSAALMALSARA